MKNNLKFDIKTQTELLLFLLENIKGRSRNNIKGLLKRGQITVNGEVCTEYSRVLYPGQVVEVLPKGLAANYKMELPVIYEDDELIVIDKPAGMLAIATDRERERTAYHIVTDYVKNSVQGGRVFIVHRLDKDTSGLMLFARNERIKRALQDNWDSAAMYRGYTAIAEGRVSPERGTIKSWLKQTKTLLVYSGKEGGGGKEAVTNYETIKSNDDYTLLCISLGTGRKNQIRVQLSEIGNPVAGDKKYGARTNPLGRLGLHATKLIISHPFTKKQMCFESMPPKVFEKVFTGLR